MSFSFSARPLYMLGTTLVAGWPLTLLAAASVAWGVTVRRAVRISPRSAPAGLLALLLLPSLLIIVASGFWYDESTLYIPNGAAHATIFASFGAQVILSIYLNRRMRDPRETAFFFIVPALYVTGVAVFIGLISVGGGGSL